MNVSRLNFRSPFAALALEEEQEGGGDSGGGEEQSGEEQSGEQQEEAQRPEWLPEKFWNAEAKAPSVENLAKSYAELERNRTADPEKLKETWETERLAARPESPDKYELPTNEALDPDLLANSPVVKLWRKAAHEAGVGQEQFTKVIDDFAKEEMTRLSESFNAEMSKLGENAKARTEAAGLWGQKFFAGEGEFEAFQQMTTTAAGIAAAEKLMKVMADAGVEVEGEAANDGKDDMGTIRKLMDSKAYYDPMNRDPKVVARVEAFFKTQE